MPVSWYSGPGQYAGWNSETCAHQVVTPSSPPSLRQTGQTAIKAHLVRDALVNQRHQANAQGIQLWFEGPDLLCLLSAKYCMHHCHSVPMHRRANSVAPLATGLPPGLPPGWTRSRVRNALHPGRRIGTTTQGWDAQRSLATLVVSSSTLVKLAGARVDTSGRLRATIALSVRNVGGCALSVQWKLRRVCRNTVCDESMFSSEL